MCVYFCGRLCEDNCSHFIGHYASKTFDSPAQLMGILTVCGTTDKSCFKLVYAIALTFDLSLLSINWAEALSQSMGKIFNSHGIMSR